jgi:hypothetical protein
MRIIKQIEKKRVKKPNKIKLFVRFDYFSLTGAYIVRIVKWYHRVQHLQLALK